MMRPCHALIAAAVLSACAGPEDAARRIDPRTADYADLRVFVALPGGQAPAPGSPELSIRSRSVGEGTRRARTTLVPVADRRTPDGSVAYAVPRGELPALDAVAHGVRDAGGPGTAAVALRIEGCRMGPPDPSRRLAIAVAAPGDTAPVPLIRPGTAPSPVVEAHLDAKAPCP